MGAKEAARERLERELARLVALSHRIHAHPELAFEEERACTWISETLDGAGFRVTRGYAGLPTAFLARAGSGPLHVAFLAEYDCLPGIGHACGHNVIAAMAVGAGLAAARVALLIEIGNLHRERGNEEPIAERHERQRREKKRLEGHGEVAEHHHRAADDDALRLAEPEVSDDAADERTEEGAGGIRAEND